MTHDARRMFFLTQWPCDSMTQSGMFARSHGTRQVWLLIAKSSVAASPRRGPRALKGQLIPALGNA